MEEVARAAIERWMGDNDGDADTIYDEAFTLAFDALVDHGCPHAEARKIASEEAMRYAQP